MLRVEFHCHTSYSKDSLTRPEDLISGCRRKGIDRVVITDHNSIQGALIANRLEPEMVIIGEEIMTTRGEILAAFIKEHIPPLLTPQKTVQLLKQQNAFISVSHPFDRLRSGGWQERDLLEILTDVDAIETFNSRCMLSKYNRQAQEFAQRHHLAGTVGSDAHAVFELGRSILLVEPFEGPDDLRRAIRTAEFDVKWSPPWMHFASRYASFIKSIGIHRRR